MAGILRESYILCSKKRKKRKEKRENHTSCYGLMVQTEIYIFRAYIHTHTKKKFILARGKLKYGTQV